MSNDSSKNNESQDFESELRTKVEDYFSQGGTLSNKSDLDTFLDSCGLLELWNSEEEKQAVWISIVAHKSEAIDCECVLKGLSDLMNQAGGTNDDEPRISVSALFNNMSDDKLNEYKTLFDTLDLNNVHTIDEADITTAISINGLTLTNEEVSSCMKALSS